MPRLITTLGPKYAEEMGMILPHEHIFTDLRLWNQPGYARANPAEVVALMKPELLRAKAAGVTAIAEATTVGVGRRADILKAVSKAAQFPLLVPTGVYREPWIPDWVHKSSEDELREWMISELVDEIEGSGIQAGWIKISAGDEEMTPCEAKVLRAAAAAGAATGAVIGSHTVRGEVVLEQLAILEKAGYTPERFIWVHAQAEPFFDMHFEVALRGAWIEYDWIGGDMPDAHFIRHIKRLLDAGLGNHVLLSHDRGYYDPAQPKGGKPRPFTYITEQFIPQLLREGIDEATIRQLTHDNPFRAFAR